jgi:hypothetical protein
MRSKYDSLTDTIDMIEGLLCMFDGHTNIHFDDG